MYRKSLLFTSTHVFLRALDGAETQRIIVEKR